MTFRAGQGGRGVTGFPLRALRYATSGPPAEPPSVTCKYRRFLTEVPDEPGAWGLGPGAWGLMPGAWGLGPRVEGRVGPRD
jgi:hypothetical protein